eukprot:SAG25_NODE_12202_length_285_cov_0.833333_1_plen_32_part_10
MIKLYPPMSDVTVLLYVLHIDQGQNGGKKELS